MSFLSKQKEISDEEKQGRTSGSVEWRRARGELGQTKEVRITHKNVQIFTCLQQDDLRLLIPSLLATWQWLIHNSPLPLYELNKLFFVQCAEI